ncbi:MAG: nucleotidyltransferase family protein [Planctomycetes bacterium]|nr:nucleotidyltransferase family protein [Planctomycetota bacterium]
MVASTAPAPWISALLLAAGRSRRMGRDKLALDYGGRPMLARTLAAYLEARELAEVVMVVGPESAGPPAPPRCRRVVNPDPERGMRASLRLALAAADPRAAAWLVGLGDMPEISPGLVDALVAAWRRAPGRILVPAFRGRRGHPVLLRADLRDELLALAGDVGARSILAAHPDDVAVFPTDDPAVLFDVDVPADLTRCRERGL